MKSTPILIAGSIAIAIALIFFGRSFGGDGTTTITQGPGGHAANAAFAVSSSGDAAPDFALTALTGETIRLSDYRGEKPVILDFFATWCPNCRRDMPKLSRFYEQYGDQVEVIGVNLQEREGKVSDFVDTFGVTFPVVLDPFQQAVRSYGVQYTNYHVLISKEGTIAGIVPGDISESHILQLIENS